MTTIRLLQEPGVYGRLEAIAAEVERGLRDAAEAAGQKVIIQRVGAMLTPFFLDRPVRDWADADACDRDKFGRWHAKMLENGVHWPPSQFEVGFPSLAHDAESLAKTAEAARGAFEAL
jgi:glutamate-1-semialdehyde 2,1-aminomutase